MNAERADRLAAHGDYTVAPEQQLSDIWHKALRHPGELQENETSETHTRYINDNFYIADLTSLK